MLISPVALVMSQCNISVGWVIAERRVIVRDPKFKAAVRASADGRFTFQIFTVSGEPRTFEADGQHYGTPAEAVQAGYKALAAKHGLESA
jgi:hypothetical protein